MMPHHRAVVLAMCMLFVPATSVRAEETDAPARDVKRAIEAGVAYLKGEQDEDGSWSGFPGQPGGVTALMTCAGIASMAIASRRLAERREAAGNGQDARHLDNPAEIPEIKSALVWLERHFSVRRNPTGRGIGEEILSRSWLMHYLHTLRRAGNLIGQRFIGKHDLYREGVEILLAYQDSVSGYWVGWGHAERDRRIATAFALLFLANREGFLKRESAEKVDGSGKQPDN